MCNRRQSGCGPKIAVGSWWDTLRAPNNPLVSLDFSCSFVREIHPQIYQSINIINQLNSSSTSQRASKSHLPIGKEPVSIGLPYIYVYIYVHRIHVWDMNLRFCVCFDFGIWGILSKSLGGQKRFNVLFQGSPFKKGSFSGRISSHNTCEWFDFYRWLQWLSTIHITIFGD